MVAGECDVGDVDDAVVDVVRGLAEEDHRGAGREFQLLHLFRCRWPGGEALLDAHRVELVLSATRPGLLGVVQEVGVGGDHVADEVGVTRLKGAVSAAYRVRSVAVTDLEILRRYSKPPTAKLRLAAGPRSAR